MAQLIVVDASVAIAALSADDAHHAAAVACLIAVDDDELVLAATTRAEILVGPAAAGPTQLRRARDFVDGCAIVPITTAIADAGAALKARHRALSLPDGLAVVVADVIEADAIWTFDQRWRGVSPRVMILNRPDPHTQR